MTEQDGSAVDVGDLPLTVGTNAVASFWVALGEIRAGIEQTTVIAPWPGPGDPTAADCANLLRTQPTASLANHAGLRFCMEGAFTHHIAAGLVTSYDGTVSQVLVTVWDQGLS